MVHRLLKISSLFVLFVVIASCSENAFTPQHGIDAEVQFSDTVKKMNGVSFVAPRSKVGDDCFKHLDNISANWVAFIPYAYGPKDSKKLSWNVDWQHWGEKADGIRGCIQMAHSKGLKVMVKPQVWFNHGAFTGDFDLNDADWPEFEQSFENYVLDFAKIAQEEGAAAYCIGTEWKKFVAKRPEFWKQLIPKVRKVFKGELTYAENWDCYNKVPFWEQLDFIGIDAYFPLAEGKTPSVAELEKGWQKHVPGIKALSDRVKKPVAFTEFGYRNVDYNAAAPWESDRKEGTNNDAQSNGYTALFNTFWSQPWFKGGFLWKWHSNHERSGGVSNNKFTPQNKPAEKIVQEWYGKS